MVNKMFKYELFEIKKELNNTIKDRDKVFKQCIIERLNKGLLTYEQELEISQNYLLKKNNFTILRRM